ncbi:hypothetical protein LZ30DRAFT_284806 [Colletotrichum cereale]|nr:hypothetical protein LZ30DRAFT_284806 [Colletotrichum cereale]
MCLSTYCPEPGPRFIPAGCSVSSLAPTVNPSDTSFGHGCACGTLYTTTVAVAFSRTNTQTSTPVGAQHTAAILALLRHGHTLNWAIFVDLGTKPPTDEIRRPSHLAAPFRSSSSNLSRLPALSGPGKVTAMTPCTRALRPN